MTQHSHRKENAGTGKTAPQKITVERAQEILGELGVTPPTATTYYPLFQHDVSVIGPPPNAPTPVSPYYCLTIPSALGLMCVLADLEPVAYLAPPQEFVGTQFYFSQEVPWMTFSNGAVRNAGQVAFYWEANHGDPNGKTADTMARQEVAWG